MKNELNYQTRMAKNGKNTQNIKGCVTNINNIVI